MDISGYVWIYMDISRTFDLCYYYNARRNRGRDNIGHPPCPSGATEADQDHRGQPRPPGPTKADGANQDNRANQDHRANQGRRGQPSPPGPTKAAGANQGRRGQPRPPGPTKADGPPGQGRMLVCQGQARLNDHSDQAADGNLCIPCR